MQRVTSPISALSLSLAALAFFAACETPSDSSPDVASPFSPTPTVDANGAINGAADVDQLERWVETGDSSRVAAGLFSLTYAYRQRGNDSKSEAYLRRLRRLSAGGNEHAKAYLPTALVMSGKAEAAIPLLERAARKGNPEAAYFLSSIYSGEIDGETNLKDDEQALRWRRTAAGLGHDEARRDLAHYREHREQR